MASLPPRKRKRMKRNLLDFPGDIFTDILLRLPFDSLLYCKLVSTEWKNVINHPTFSKKYKGFTNSMSLFTDSNRILSLRIRHNKNMQLTKSLNPRFTVHPVPIAFHQNHRDPYLINCTNGIACVLNHRVYYFYNLVTGSPALHSVTDSPLPKPRSYEWEYYGFGYDAYGDDYKIVQLCHHTPKPILTDKIIDADKTQYWVYSFKNREWKSFNGFPYSDYAEAVILPQITVLVGPALHVVTGSPLCSYSRATTLNGVLHWLAPHKGVTINYDLHTGVFGEIVLPGVGVNDVGNGLDFCSGFGLQELNGKLCYTYLRRYTYHNEPLFDVWRMVGDSWEMLVSIDCAKVARNIHWSIIHSLDRPLMLYECSDGRRLILFMDDCGPIPALHWYDFINNQCETFLPSVWHQQRIKNRARAIVKRKTSLNV